MNGLKRAVLRLRGRGRSRDGDGGGPRDGRSEHDPSPPPSPPDATEQDRGGEFAGSRLCNPRGLPGGAAPDLGRGIADMVAAAKSEPPEPEPARQAAKPRQGRKSRKRKAAARREAADKAKAAPRLRAVLDTSAAVQYGRYTADLCTLSRVNEEFREILFDDAVEKVVTPAVMGEVWGLYRSNRLPEEAMRKIRPLAVECDADGAADYIARVAAAVENAQRRAAKAHGSDTAMRWLAAKRRQHQKATGDDYGPPHKMWPWSRKGNLTRLCDMAAGDRKIMAEAAAVSTRRPRTVLLSSDADVSLFGDALSCVTGGIIRVVGIEPADRRRGRGR